MEIIRLVADWIYVLDFIAHHDRKQNSPADQEGNLVSRQLYRGTKCSSF